MLVLLVHTFLKHLLQLPCGNLFTLLIFKTFGEEILQREDAEMSLDIFAVHDSGYGRNVEACLGCDVFQYHRFEIGLVPVHEIIVLVIHDGLHGAEQCVVPLFQRLHEPLG